MAEHRPSKPTTRVRFPLSAPGGVTNRFILSYLCNIPTGLRFGMGAASFETARRRLVGANSGRR